MERGEEGITHVHPKAYESRILYGLIKLLAWRCRKDEGTVWVSRPHQARADIRLAPIRARVENVQCSVGKQCAVTSLAHLALLADLVPLGDTIRLDLSIASGREVKDTQLPGLEGDSVTHIHLG